jgi:tetratricopeptide (TPR) repeat protein
VVVGTWRCRRWRGGGGCGTESNPALDPVRIVVAVFENRTGDPALDLLGVQIGHYITLGLVQIHPKVGMNPELPLLGTAARRATPAAGSFQVLALAKRTGAGLVVSGAYYLDGDRIRVQSQFVDAAAVVVEGALDSVSGPRGQPSDVVEAVTRLVMGAVAFRNKAGAANRAGDAVRPPAYDAYVEWEQSVGMEGAEAERRLRRCLELDPDFVWARYTLWDLLTDESRYPEADEVIRPLETPAMSNRTTPLEKSYVRFMRALMEGNWNLQTAAIREAARLEPTPLSLGTWGNTELRAHRTRAALEPLSRITPGDSPTVGAFLYRRALLYHELGQYDRELEEARLGQRHYPENGAFFAAEAGALTALGRLEEVDAVIARGGTATLKSGSVGDLLYHAARELRAHGHRNNASATARRAAAWFRTRIDAGRATASVRETYAHSLVLAGACKDAMPIFRDLARAAPSDLSVQAAYGGALATCRALGGRAAAGRIADVLAGSDRPFLHGQHLYQSARVLAALGDADAAVRALRKG